MNIVKFDGKYLTHISPLPDLRTLHCPAAAQPVLTDLFTLAAQSYSQTMFQNGMIHSGFFLTEAGDWKV
jgi:hypothetical protein